MLSKTERYVGAGLLVVLIGLTAANLLNIKTVKDRQSIMPPKFSISSVVQTSEGPTTVQTSGNDAATVIAEQQVLINEAKGL